MCGAVEMGGSLDGTRVEQNVYSFDRESNFLKSGYKQKDRKGFTTRVTPDRSLCVRKCLYILTVFHNTVRNPLRYYMSVPHNPRKLRISSITRWIFAPLVGRRIQSRLDLPAFKGEGVSEEFPRGQPTTGTEEQTDLPVVHLNYQE